MFFLCKVEGTATVYEYVLSCGVTCPTDYYLHSIKPYQSNLFADYPIGCQADCENPLGIVNK